MPRLMLNGELWSKPTTSLLENGIDDKPNLRIMVEGILCHTSTGSSWRDLLTQLDVGTVFIKNLIDGPQTINY